MTADLPSLLTRVEQGEGADRELDAEVGVSVGRLSATLLIGDGVVTEQRQVPHRCPPFTTSLDACVALAERVLPGWDVTWNSARKKGFHDFLVIKLHEAGEKLFYPPGFQGRAKSPARALLAAIIRAKMAEKEG